MREVKTKLQTLIDQRDSLVNRSSNLENMRLKIRISDRPETVKVGWFRDPRPVTMSWTDTHLLYEFLTTEKHKADDEVDSINLRLEKLEKKL